MLTYPVLSEESDEDTGDEIQPASSTNQQANKRDWSPETTPSETEVQDVSRTKRLKVTLPYSLHAAPRVCDILNSQSQQKTVARPRGSAIPRHSPKRNSQQTLRENNGPAQALSQRTNNESILISDDESRASLVKREMASPVAYRGNHSSQRHVHDHLSRHGSRTLSTVTTAVTSPPELKRSGTAEADKRSLVLNSVTFTFKDAHENIVEQLPFEECNSAGTLFSQAVACDIADFDSTRMLEIEVGDKAPVRIVKDSKSNFERKVLQPLLALRNELPDLPIEISVKTYK